MSTATAAAPRPPVAVALVVTALAATAAVLAAALHLGAAQPAGRPADLALPALAALLVAAGSLVVRFRHGRDVDGVTLEEAVLAPLLFAFPGPKAVAVVAIAAVATAVVRRNTLLKGAFNVAQWSLAAAIGALVIDSLAAGEGTSWRGIGAVAVALVAIGLTNNIAFTVAVGLAARQSPRRLLRALAPVIVTAWFGGFVANTVLGLLYVLAYDTTPYAVLLFPVPLVLLHLAYRGYAVAHADRQRISGLHKAAQVLAAPVDPREAVRLFLEEVSRSFDARCAALVLRTEGGREVHLLDTRTGSYVMSNEPEDAMTVTGALAALPGVALVPAREKGPVAELLRLAGHRDALAAPLLDAGRLVGSVQVLDRAGLEGLPTGELELFAALAREASAAFNKGRLLVRMMEDRSRLEQIVGTTSDGILTIDTAGTVRSWNPALERLTGRPAAEVVGRPGALSVLSLHTLDGRPVDMGGWSSGTDLPAEIRVATPTGSRRLACSYSHAHDDQGAAETLVVVARDVTPVEEAAELRAQFLRLVEREEAQRVVVEHLQAAVMPPFPHIADAEVAVTYLPSDDTAPTGGDLYDCQLLPNGELHLAVVDVLGHGVAATKDALTVVHALRTVVVDGTALEDVVRRTDELLGRQDPDLVATVVLARFDPHTGRLRVAAGGHPPALLVGARGDVHQLAASGGAIGWPGAGSDSVTESVLEPGDSLVLYTDGLVEARKDILTGMEDLVRFAAEVAAQPAAQAADTLVERALAGAQRRDDTLALVLRRLPVAARPTTARWQLAPVVADASRSRRSIVSWMQQELKVEQGALDDAAVVLAELLANAVRAARSAVNVHAGRENDKLFIEVTDDGHGDESLVTVGRELPPTWSESGRGLLLVRSLSEHVELFSSAEGSSVRAVLPLSRPGVRVSPAAVPQPAPSPAEPRSE